MYLKARIKKCIDLVKKACYCKPGCPPDSTGKALKEARYEVLSVILHMRQVENKVGVLKTKDGNYNYEYYTKTCKLSAFSFRNRKGNISRRIRNGSVREENGKHTGGVEDFAKNIGRITRLFLLQESFVGSLHLSYGDARKRIGRAFCENPCPRRQRSDCCHRE